MRVCQIEIERFRGIEHLVWRPRQGMACLFGPCDSGKTTILEAIDLTLSPRRYVPFDDVDFYGADTSEPISITVTLVGVPSSLLSLTKYGGLARGWTPDGVLADEPGDHEPALSIRLLVDGSLEPSWSVVNTRSPSGRRISARDREALCCTRVGDYVDRHLAWGKSSLLTKLVDGEGPASAFVADANRRAREIISTDEGRLPNGLRRAVRRAQLLARFAGVRRSEDYRAGLDARLLTTSMAGLALHEGSIPLRMSGLGSRRLLAAALQAAASRAGGILLIDELEHSLEPHRVRKLARSLSASGQHGQAFATTHSPVVLSELAADNLYMVRADDRRVRVVEVPPHLQPVVRRTGEAMLSRRILVCEGKTELGLCRGLDSVWEEEGESFALHSTALLYGGGSSAARTATELAALGFDVGLLADSDVPMTPSLEDLDKAGVELLIWTGGLAVEQRLAKDLPPDGVLAMLHLAVELRGVDAVRSSLASRLGGVGALDDRGLVQSSQEWKPGQVAVSDVRDALGECAKARKGWFKNAPDAEELFRVAVRPHLAELGDTDVGAKIGRIREWCRS